jgi:hypothetical protein
MRRDSHSTRQTQIYRRMRPAGRIDRGGGNVAVSGRELAAAIGCGSGAGGGVVAAECAAEGAGETSDRDATVRACDSREAGGERSVDSLVAPTVATVASTVAHIRINRTSVFQSAGLNH